MTVISSWRELSAGDGVISSRRRELSAAEGGSYLQLMEGVISS